MKPQNRRPESPSKAVVAAKAGRTAAAGSKGKVPRRPTPVVPPVPSAEIANREAGRPTIYTEELGMQIAELLADGRTLTSICREDPSLPADRTVRRWALDKNHPFCPLYARARELGWHAMGDETVDLADEPTADATQVARNRLRVDTRKWVLSKMLPRIFGERLALNADVRTSSPGILDLMTSKPPGEWTGPERIEFARRSAFVLNSMMEQHLVQDALRPDGSGLLEGLVKRVEAQRAAEARTITSILPLGIGNPAAPRPVPSAEREGVLELLRKALAERQQLEQPEDDQDHDV